MIGLKKTKSGRSLKRRILVGITAVLALIAVIAAIKWKSVTDHGGQQPVEPFRIAGNLYYVGANDVTSFLLTGSEGHVLIDGGYPGTAPMIMESIAKLGFDIADVKVLLNSHAHFDHAGGLAALQKASGARLWVSEGDADIVASGGAGDPSLGPFSFVSYFPLIRYPAPRVDHRFKDGDKIRLGDIELTANVTAGHTPGCTSWSFPVRDGMRELLAVNICSLSPPPALSLGEYPEIKTDFERSFRTLRSLPADIFLTSHAKEFGRWRKFQQSTTTTTDPVAPFIDRDGYLKNIDKWEENYRNEIKEQQQAP